MGHSVPPRYANVQIRQGGFPTAVNKIGKQFYSYVKLFWGFTVLRFRHTYSTGGWPQIPSPVFPLLLGRAAIFAGLAPFTGIHVGYKPRRAFFMLFPPVLCPRSPVTSTLCAACYKRTILLPSCHTFWTWYKRTILLLSSALELSKILNLLQMHNAVAEFWVVKDFKLVTDVQCCYKHRMLQPFGVHALLLFWTFAPKACESTFLLAYLFTSSHLVFLGINKFYRKICWPNAEYCYTQNVTTAQSLIEKCLTRTLLLTKPLQCWSKKSLE